MFPLGVSEKIVERPFQWFLFAVSLCLGGIFLAWLPLSSAIAIHAYGGYFFCSVVFAVVFISTIQIIREFSIHRFVRSRWRGLLLVAFAVVLVHLHKPHMMRALGEEPIYQMLARQFHENRLNAFPEVGYRLEGGMVYGAQSLDHRMYFYPFLVSILHDLTGFRVVNGLWANAALALLLFLSVYIGGNRINSNAGGVIAVLLLSGLPLIDESITSYGYEITNLLFLSLYFLALSFYLDRSDNSRLNFLIATSFALVYAGAESSICLFVTGVIVGWRLFADQDSRLTWFATLSPWLFLPLFASQRILEAKRLALADPIPQLGSESFFSFFVENLIGVGAWLFDFSATTPSYPLLSLLGVIAFVALTVGLLSDLRNGEVLEKKELSLLLFLAVILGSLFIITPFSYKDLVNHDSLRLLLPLHLGFSIISIWLIERSQHPVQAGKGLFVIAAFGLLLIGMPSKMRGVGGDDLVASKYADWAIDWMDEVDDGNTLYLSRLSTLFLLHDYPALGLNQAQLHSEEVSQLRAEDFYGRIVIFLIEKFDTRSGEWRPLDNAEPLSAFFEGKVIAERRWAFNQRARFLELEAFFNREGERVLLDDLRSLREEFESFQDYRDAMLESHLGIGLGESRYEP